LKSKFKVKQAKATSIGRTDSMPADVAINLRDKNIPVAECQRALEE
jgi:hypothetical protein